MESVAKTTMDDVVDTTVERAVALEKEIVRFDIHQRIQHIGLMVTFILLAITGLPLKFHDWSISQWWIGVWGGIDNIRFIHHWAAYAIVLVSVYHLGYLAYTIFVLKRPFPIKMIPSSKDFQNLFQEFGYFLGLRKERPKFDRFNWREKFDYWAIFWGMPVMVISGFILMYPVFATKFLPGSAIPIAVFNHLAPGVFPLNKSIFTGKLTEERYRHEHPLEYERLSGSAKEQERLPEVTEKKEGLSELAGRKDGMSEAAARKERIAKAAEIKEKLSEAAKKKDRLSEVAEKNDDSSDESSKEP
jgi:cytochrome b subunit of formate dehydrogenase